MAAPSGNPASAPWWRRRRGAIDTAVALLVVPAVIGIALAAGGAFDGDDPGDTVPVSSGAPEIQGPVLPGATTAPAPTPTQITATPTTAAPTTAAPTTAAPTTAVPTTAVPTTAVPTTAVPTTAAPTTAAPTTAAATTAATTTAAPTTAAPTTAAPTIAAPITTTPAPSPTATTPAAPRPPPATTPPVKAQTLGKAPAAKTGDDFAFARGTANIDLKTWQTQMAKRGWDITPDGVFGSETQRVLTSFQAEKGLSVDGLLGPQSWTAAWNAPVT